jgi:hypothetical protein
MVLVNFGCSGNPNSGDSGTPAQPSGVWLQSSVGVEVMHSSGWIRPGMASTNTDYSCSAIARTRMSSDQINMMATLAPVTVGSCGLCDGWDDHYLTVLDQDGSRGTYPGPNCACNGTSPTTIISANFFAAFPLDGAEACSN